MLQTTNLTEGQQIAHKGTNENSHVVYLATIIGFDGIAIHVMDQLGNKYWLNTWNLCELPDTKPNFEAYAIGTKITSYDKDGYYVMNLCGTLASYLGGGHAIIKAHDGLHYSTVSNSRVASIEATK